METATMIGFGMLIVFLIGVIIAIINDTRREKRFWDDWKKE
ncbi:putative holin-like toxin [Mucilaginibacter paludis]|uniref:Uncharacterized protein n=1 Tax=Mucilaginibacter paludis DSM 18603 TaxID=714943 RepID=H1YHV2_9SPHI|nr:putative holin-like toxin [Mucilaginibacter paludis]EHQ27502.1 hypothetical protein Mucpa_3403 [Mucilaginibacter paludis DSM 18603]